MPRAQYLHRSRNVVGIKYCVTDQIKTCIMYIARTRDTYRRHRFVNDEKRTLLSYRRLGIQNTCARKKINNNTTRDKEKKIVDERMLYNSGSQTILIHGYLVMLKSRYYLYIKHIVDL